MASLDLLLEDVFQISRDQFFANSRSIDVHDCVCGDDYENIVSESVAWAPLEWRIKPHPKLKVTAKSLRDTVCSSQASRVTAVVGTYGSGKTTLVFAAAALAGATRGVELDARGSARSLLSVITANALPWEDLWGSRCARGLWKDGAASAMIRSAIIPGTPSALSISEAIERGCIAGARWILFDFDGKKLTSVFPLH